MSTLSPENIDGSEAAGWIVFVSAPSPDGAVAVTASVVCRFVSVVGALLVGSFEPA